MIFFKKGNRIFFQFKYEQSIIEVLKKQRAFWDGNNRLWWMRDSNLRGLYFIFTQLNFQPKTPEDAFFKEKLLAEATHRQAIKKFIEEQLPLQQLKHHFKTKPMRHQEEAVLVLQRANGRQALFFEMGTGKSKIALDWVTYSGKTTLLVAPKQVILGSWVEEVEKHSFLRASYLLGTKKKRLEALKEPADIYIINYEGILSIYNELEKWLTDQHQIILDESIRIKNPQAKITKALLKLGKKTNFKVILTGLPATKGFIDLFSQLQFLNCFLMPDTLTSFKQRYCIMGGFNDKEVVGYKNEEELEEAIGLYAFQKTRDECMDLPPKVYEKMVVEPNKKLEELLKLARSQKLVTPTMNSARNKLITLRRLSGGFFEEEMIDTGKLEVIKELLEQHKKLVVWCSFRQEARGLFEKLQEYNPVLVWGKQQNDFYIATDEAVQRFQNDPDCRVFIGIPAAAKYGLTLTAANVAVYYSNDFSLDNRQQSEDRIYRHGQNRKVVIIDLVMKGGVDDFILDNLLKKRSEAEMIKQWLAVEEGIQF